MSEGEKEKSKPVGFPVAGFPGPYEVYVPNHEASANLLVGIDSNKAHEMLNELYLARAIDALNEGERLDHDHYVTAVENLIKIAPDIVRPIFEKVEAEWKIAEAKRAERGPFRVNNYVQIFPDEKKEAT
jgi:hypothetical protein